MSKVRQDQTRDLWSIRFFFFVFPSYVYLHVTRLVFMYRILWAMCTTPYTEYYADYSTGISISNRLRGLFFFICKSAVGRRFYIHTRSYNIFLVSRQPRIVHRTLADELAIEMNSEHLLGDTSYIKWVTKYSDIGTILSGSL